MGDLISVLTKRFNRGSVTSWGGMPKCVAVISVLKMIFWTKDRGTVKFLKMVRFRVFIKRALTNSGWWGI